MGAEIKCSQCDGEMIVGFIFDRTGYGKTQQAWAKGKPENSVMGGLKNSDREMYHVQAFRCVKCNYLKFYTTERIYI